MTRIKEDTPVTDSFGISGLGRQIQRGFYRPKPDPFQPNVYLDEDSNIAAAFSSLRCQGLQHNRGVEGDGEPYDIPACPRPELLGECDPNIVITPEGQARIMVRRTEMFLSD